MEELQGKILDRKYKLVRLIGEGGMGSVWEAEHTRISRRVAVKVMHSTGQESQEVLSRFFLEAQSASAIGHPNIIEIFDVGVEEDGTAFMVMELLNGVSLEGLLLDRGSLPPARVVAIILQVLSALHAAHAKGIIHRDMKPDNIFLSVDTRMREDIKLLDFGVAKILAADTETLKLTKPGTVLGTPYYLSPEQARGGKDIDARIDIWATGVVMYEMLSGRMPFDGDNYNEVIGNVLMNEAPPLLDVAPEVPFELAKVVVKAMAKDRDKRYRNVGEMIKALMPLHDDMGGGMGTASARAVKDSVAPLPPKGESTESVTTGSGHKEDKIETLSPDLLMTLDVPGESISMRKVWISAVGAAALIAGVIAFWALTGEDVKPSAEMEPGKDSSGVARGEKEPGDVDDGVEKKPVTGQADAGVRKRLPEKETDEAHSEMVKIWILGLPPRARVLLGGVRVTPPLIVPASTKTITLKITAPGYRPYTETVIPKKDTALTITMKKAPAAGPSKKTGQTPTKKKGWKDNPFG